MLIRTRIGEVLNVSKLYSTPPEGYRSSNEFLNQAIKVETHLDPEKLLYNLQEIEQYLGRTKKSKDGVYEDRLIDLDILTFNENQINKPFIKIPHPRILERTFVLLPLLEIYPHSLETLKFNG